MKPVILKADQSGKILITAEEIEKIVSDAYDQGYQDGKGSVVTVTYDPQTTWNKWPPNITCDSVTFSSVDSH